MISVKEAAALKGLSTQLIYLWGAERRLPHFRLGGRGRRGRILIDLADLDAFMTTLKVASHPPGDDGEFRHSRRPSGSPS